MRLCRPVQSSCLHYMPCGVSSTLDYMHVALSYYVGVGTLYHCIIEIQSYFYPAKFDNFKDENILDYKTVSVAQSKKLLH